jgi:hypothetical protein
MFRKRRTGRRVSAACNAPRVVWAIAPPSGLARPTEQALARLDGVFTSSQHRPMALPRNRMLSLAACCILCACGARPDPPGATSPGEGTSLVGGNPDEPAEQPGDQVAVLGAQPSDPPPASSSDAEPPDGGEPSPPPDRDVAEPEPTGGALAACTKDGGNCLIIKVAIRDLANQSCVQLALDDCGNFDRGGLRVDVPLSWRVASASVGRLEDDCTPAADFDPGSAIILRADGEITWNQETAVPSDLVIDLTLEPPAAASVQSPTSVVGQLAGKVPECDG